MQWFSILDASPTSIKPHHLFSDILPEAFQRMPDLTPGRVAILYPAAWIGDDVGSQAERLGFDIVRTDVNALYPRGSRLMRWLEDLLHGVSRMAAPELLGSQL